MSNYNKAVAACEFCNKPFPLEELEATSFCGPYCKSCLKLMILEARYALDRITQREVINTMVASLRDKE